MNDFRPSFGRAQTSRGNNTEITRKKKEEEKKGAESQENVVVRGKCVCGG
jgi:hypothetical protein